MEHSLNVTMRPVVSIDNLKKAIEEETGEEFDDLTNLLFYEDYMNDCYKNLYFADDPWCYEEKPDYYDDIEWEEECEKVRKLKLVYSYLRKIFGKFYDAILVDVSW